MKLIDNIFSGTQSYGGDGKLRVISDCGESIYTAGEGRHIVEFRFYGDYLSVWLDNNTNIFFMPKTRRK